MTADSDPKVRLQLALTLGEWDAPVAGAALAELAVAHSNNKFMRAAVFSSATPHVKTLAKVVSKAEADTRSKLLDSMLELAFAMKDYGVMATLLEPVFVARNGHFSTTQLEAAETFCQTVSRKKGTVSGFANQNASLAQILSGGESGGSSIFHAAEKICMDQKESLKRRGLAAKLLGWDTNRREKEIRGELLDLIW